MRVLEITETQEHPTITGQRRRKLTAQKCRTRTRCHGGGRQVRGNSWCCEIWNNLSEFAMSLFRVIEKEFSMRVEQACRHGRRMQFPRCVAQRRRLLGRRMQPRAGAIHEPAIIVGAPVGHPLPKWGALITSEFRNHSTLRARSPESPRR